MKDGVIIINTARGAIIDEASLVSALGSGKVSSCGLDVYENEPEIHPGLVNNDRVMLLPHMGTNTIEVSTTLFQSHYFLVFPPFFSPAYISTLSLPFFFESAQERKLWMKTRPSITQFL